MLGIETVSENITEGEIRHIQREGNVHGKKKKISINTLME